MALLFGDGAMQPALLANQLRPGPALPRQTGMVSPALSRAFNAALAIARANPPANAPRDYVDYATVGPGPYAWHNPNNPPDVLGPYPPGTLQDPIFTVPRPTPLVINSPGWYHPLLRGSAPPPTPWYERPGVLQYAGMHPAVGAIANALQGVSPY